MNDFDRVASDDLIGVIVRSKLSKGRDEIEELSVSLEKTTKKANNMKTNIRTFPRLAKCIDKKELNSFDLLLSLKGG